MKATPAQVPGIVPQSARWREKRLRRVAVIVSMASLVVIIGGTLLFLSWFLGGADIPFLHGDALANVGAMAAFCGIVAGIVIPLMLWLWLSVEADLTGLAPTVPDKDILGSWDVCSKALKDALGQLRTAARSVDEANGMSGSTAYWIEGQYKQHLLAAYELVTRLDDALALRVAVHNATPAEGDASGATTPNNPLPELQSQTAAAIRELARSVQDMCEIARKAHAIAPEGGGALTPTAQTTACLAQAHACDEQCLLLLQQVLHTENSLVQHANATELRTARTATARTRRARPRERLSRNELVKRGIDRLSGEHSFYRSLSRAGRDVFIAVCATLIVSLTAWATSIFFTEVSMGWAHVVISWLTIPIMLLFAAIPAALGIVGGAGAVGCVQDVAAQRGARAWNVLKALVLGIVSLVLIVVGLRIAWGAVAPCVRDVPAYGNPSVVELTDWRTAHDTGIAPGVAGWQNTDTYSLTGTDVHGAHYTFPISEDVYYEHALQDLTGSEDTMTVTYLPGTHTVLSLDVAEKLG